MTRGLTVLLREGRALLGEDDPSLEIKNAPEGLGLYVDGKQVGTLRVFGSVRDLNKRLRTTPHSPFNTETSGKVGWLPVVELDSGMRGKGIGTKLMKLLFAQAKKKGIKSILLHAGDPWGHSSGRQEAFWSRLGFQRLRYDDGTYFSQPLELKL